MQKKTINDKEPSFIQSINISNQWCKDWENNLLSEEVLADRISELIRSTNGRRGFFAFALSNIDCTLLDKLPTSLIFKLREQGKDIVEITIKNFIMSTAQIVNHKRDNNQNYLEISENISERCANLLGALDTNLVTKGINEIIQNLDQMGNSLDKSTTYDAEQKTFIRERIQKITNKKG